MPNKPTTTIKSSILDIEQRLDQAGVFFGHGTDNARDEAVWLVCGILGIDFDRLDDVLDQAVSDSDQRKIEALISQRIEQRIPTAYLLQQAWFAGLEFYVDQRVLIPRSHIGELILEGFSPWIAADKLRHVLDLCTGSGCIAVAIAHYLPHIQVDASDISAEALAVARINIDRHQVGDRVQLIQSDLFQGIGKRKYDLIVTNPPYVAEQSMRKLPEEYRHEPVLALASGEAGLDAVDIILKQAKHYLNPGGLLIAEVGESAERLQARYPKVPFLWLATATGEESVFMLTYDQLA